MVLIVEKQSAKIGAHLVQLCTDEPSWASATKHDRANPAEIRTDTSWSLFQFSLCRLDISSSTERRRRSSKDDRKAQTQPQQLRPDISCTVFGLAIASRALQEKLKTLKQNTKFKAKSWIRISNKFYIALGFIMKITTAGLRQIDWQPRYSTIVISTKTGKH